MRVGDDGAGLALEHRGASAAHDDRTEELRLRALACTTVGSFTASIAA